MSGRRSSKGAATSSLPTLPTLPASNACQGRIEIAARHRLKPLRQGELDYMCGLYAPINAMRLALADCAPLAREDYKALFTEGVGYLNRKKGLYSSLTWGLTLRRRHALACYLAEHVSNAHVRVSIERPDHKRWRSIEDAFAWIEQSLAANHPVLVYFAEEPDHYTVIAGSTPTQLQLFDSAGTSFVHKAGCDLRSGTHIIWPNGLLRVVVKPPG